MFRHLVLHLLLLRWREIDREGRGLLVVGGVFALGGLLAWVTRGFFEGLAGDPALLTVALAGWIGVTVLGAGLWSPLEALRALYVGRDAELFLAAPIPPSRLFVARLVEVFLARALLPTVAVFSCLAGGGVVLGAAPGFYPVALATSLLAGLVGCALGFLAVFLLVRIVPVRLLDGAFTYVGAGLAVGAGLFLAAYSETLGRPEGWLHGMSGWSEHPVSAPGGMLVGALEGAWLPAAAGLLAAAAMAGAAVLVASLAFAATYRAGYDRMERATAFTGARGSSRWRGEGRLEAVRRRFSWLGALTAGPVPSIARQEWKHFLRDPVLRGRITFGLVLVAVAPIPVALDLGAGSEAGERPLLAVTLGAALLAGGAILTVVMGLSAFAREGRNIELLCSAPLHATHLLAGKVLGVAVPVAGLLLAIQAVFWLAAGVSLPQGALATVATVVIVGGLATIAVSLSALLSAFVGPPPGETPGPVAGVVGLVASLTFLYAAIGLPLFAVLVWAEASDGLAALSPVLLGAAVLHLLALGAVLVGLPLLVGWALRRLEGIAADVGGAGPPGGGGAATRGTNSR